MAFPSIIPGEETLLTGLSKSAGEGLGAGLSSGLQAIANLKLQDLQSRQAQRAYGQSAGKMFEMLNVPPEKAQSIGLAMSGLSPQERSLFWQNPGAIAALLGNQQQQMQPSINMPQQMLEVPPEQIAGPYTPMNMQPQMQTAQQIQQPMAQMQQPQTKAQQLAAAFISPQEKRQQQMLELQQEKAEDRRQEKLKPFIEKIQNEDARWQTIRHKATAAAELLAKAKAKFPGYFAGNVPESMSSWVIRDPDVREYQGIINDLIPLLASEPGQRLTNMMLKLKQMAKANVSQPVETQAALLQNILDETNLRKDTTDYMESLRNQETGNFPKDVSSRVTEFRHAQDDPLKYPQYFKHNTIYLDDSGKKFMNVMGKRWQYIKD